MLLTVLTQKSEEMPVKRIHPNQQWDVALAKLSSWSSKNPDSLLSTKIYGANREDGFYLFPTGAIVRDGQVQVELSGANPIIRIVQLPIKDPPERVLKFPREDVPPGAKPDPRPLKMFIFEEDVRLPVARRRAVRRRGAYSRRPLDFPSSGEGRPRRDGRAAMRSPREATSPDHHNVSARRRKVQGARGATLRVARGVRR